MGFKIEEVITSADIKKFIKFPHKLYSSNKQYVPVLNSDEFKVLTDSPSLEYCKIKMWVAISEQKEIVGRIAGIYNPRSNEVHKEKRVRFGWFDFIEDKKVAEALLEKVAEWGKGFGMTEMHGPLGYNTWNRQGMLIEGFENIPPINCLYNFAYYPRIMEELGIGKQVDWVQVKIEANAGVPNKLRRINQMLLDKYKLRVIDIKEMKGNEKLIRSFFKSYNESFKKIDNFIPLTKSEADQIVKEYFPKLKDELTSIIIDQDNEIAAFGVCFPNLSKSFQKAKGKFLPFGMFHIMREFKRYDTIDLMILGAAPKWQNKGISSIYHTYIASNLESGRIKYAISNPQAENNSAYKVWSRYSNKPYMKRRCYLTNIE